jgi:putative membrane protein
MFSGILNLIFSTLAVILTAELLPGVELESWKVGILLALVLGLMNTFLRPVLKLLALPINILSLGLFSLVINGIIVLLADKLIDGFFIPGLLTAIIFGLVLGIINSLFNTFKA